MCLADMVILEMFWPAAFQGLIFEIIIHACNYFHTLFHWPDFTSVFTGVVFFYYYYFLTSY